MARFSSRAIGPTLTYAGVLLIGVIASTVWIVVSGEELVWSTSGCGLAMVHGVSVAAMCLLLYAGLASTLRWVFGPLPINGWRWR
ncbi:MAG: hypothetical protein J0I81_00555 [Hyphomicrobium sp.]|nr:hypothetical protein [Hyphomicrobium sp.]